VSPSCLRQSNDTAFAPLSPEILQPKLSCHWCKDWAGGDTIFDHIAALHHGKSLSSVLDAGTGTSSLKWVALELKPKRWTAVTATQRALKEVQTSSKVTRGMREADQIVVGNWRNASLLEGEKYDLILADYLLGAVDGHAPYFQEELFGRLKKHLTPGGRMYVVGKDPPASPPRFKFPGARSTHIQHGVHQVEDVDHLLKACLHHASRAPYREYPLSWVLEHAEKAGLKVESKHAFPVVIGTKALHAQLDVCNTALNDIEGRHLHNGIKERISQLRERIDANPMIKDNGVCYGIDYVVALSA